MLTQGVSNIAEDIHGDMTNGEAGTDTTLFDKDQTGVITAISNTDIAVTSKTLSTNSINIEYKLSVSLANGDDVSEYEVNNGTIAYNRAIRPGLGKTDNDELTMIHAFQFLVV